MSTDKAKRSANPGPKGAAQSSGAGRDKPTGRAKFDERGNAVWEWKIATGTFGEEVSARQMQKLEHPALSIADEGTRPNTVRANPLGAKKGYDPYDSGKLGRKPGKPQKTDLRRLGEWLKLKKQAEKTKQGQSKD
ncbi:MAG: hypothetical protein ACLPV8_19420 [Steroidobacteraceae bacterium]